MWKLRCFQTEQILTRTLWNSLSWSKGWCLYFWIYFQKVYYSKFELWIISCKFSFRPQCLIPQSFLQSFPFSLSVPLSLLLLPLLLTLLLEVPDSLSIPGKEEIPQSFPHTQCKFSSVSLLVPLLPLLINFCYMFFASCKFSFSYF